MITVTLIPILSDNYAFLLEADNGETAIVDPGEAAPIIQRLEAHDIKPDMVLITHYHGDHVHGLPEILKWHDCRVIGKKHDDVDAFIMGGEAVEVIQTPGHKSDHVCFHFPQSGILLSGDTLFAMGCGRVLDGTAEELYASLQKLKALPDETSVYCGHEYTLSNAKFCAHIAPDNSIIKERLGEIESLRANETPTIPTTIAAEKETNVFLMTKSAAEFATLRKSKDNF